MDITPITVYELNNYIKERMDEDEFLNNVYIKGEISNFKLHYTGHMYFTLKDDKALVKCIMFKSDTIHLNFMPKDGMKVIVLGRVSTFVRDGVYQIYVKAMKEDLFDAEHKKPIPSYPKQICVLTASTGAVIRDIINVSTRRNPNVHIMLVPVPVQGDGAKEKIVEGIHKINDEKLGDVIILGRGGGSLEDLWPFNEEIVARAIYDSEIPIISAVGHETDFSISDFVADLRAPTPSAAAELAVPNIADVEYTIDVYRNRYCVSLKKKMELSKLRYEKVMNSKAFKDPLQKLNEKRMQIDIQVKNFENSINLKLKNANLKFEKVVAKIDALSPMKTLSRGYSIAEKDNKILKSISQIEKDDDFKLRLNDGSIVAKVLEKNSK